MLNLEPIKARMKAATPGPWHKSFCEVRGSGIVDSKGQYILISGMSENNQEFIIHAQTDIPALVAEVEKLRSFVGHMALTKHKEGNKNAPPTA